MAKKETEVEKPKKTIENLEAFKRTKMDNPCKLVSRLDQPVTISYNGRGLVIPPRASGKRSIVIPDRSKLGGVPAGITIIKY